MLDCSGCSVTKLVSRCVTDWGAALSRVDADFAWMWYFIYKSRLSASTQGVSRRLSTCTSPDLQNAHHLYVSRFGHPSIECGQKFYMKYIRRSSPSLFTPTHASYISSTKETNAFLCTSNSLGDILGGTGLGFSYAFGYMLSSNCLGPITSLFFSASLCCLTSPWIYWWEEGLEDDAVSFRVLPPGKYVPLSKMIVQVHWNVLRPFVSVRLLVQVQSYL